MMVVVVATTAAVVVVLLLLLMKALVFVSGIIKTFQSYWLLQLN
jgi:hypothetical protein